MRQTPQYIALRRKCRKISKEGTLIQFAGQDAISMGVVGGILSYKVENETAVKKICLSDNIEKIFLNGRSTNGNNSSKLSALSKPGRKFKISNQFYNVISLNDGFLSYQGAVGVDSIYLSAANLSTITLSDNRVNSGNRTNRLVIGGGVMIQMRVTSQLKASFDAHYLGVKNGRKKYTAIEHAEILLHIGDKIYTDKLVDSRLSEFVVSYCLADEIRKLDRKMKISGNNCKSLGVKDGILKYQLQNGAVCTIPETEVDQFVLINKLKTASYKIARATREVFDKGYEKQTKFKNMNSYFEFLISIAIADYDLHIDDLN
ncbi:MAG: hypothetical protein ACJAYB_000074 [Psychromonas sp.]|jgi:hypothetical protein